MPETIITRRQALCAGAGGTLSCSLLGSWLGNAQPAIHINPRYRLAGLRLVNSMDTERKAFLQTLGPLVYQPVTDAVDRWGETPALGFTNTGESVQTLLLALGLALVETRPGEAIDPTPLYAAEYEGRHHRRGLWANPQQWRVNARQLAADYNNHLYRYVIAYGTLVDVAAFSRITYLNFDMDYRYDTSAGIPRRWQNHWRDAPYVVDELAGRRVEMRGMLEQYNGPWFVLTHWQSLRVLDD